MNQTSTQTILFIYLLKVIIPNSLEKSRKYVNNDDC